MRPGPDSRGTFPTACPASPRWLVASLLAVWLFGCAQLPAARDLQPADLASLAGKWVGYRQYPGGERDPTAVTIKEDGSFSATVGNPPFWRFGGRVTIDAGKVVYQTGNTSGTLTLHAGDTERILTGNVAGKEREGLRGDISYQLWIKWGPAQ